MKILKENLGFFEILLKCNQNFRENLVIYLEKLGNQDLSGFQGAESLKASGSIKRN